MGCAASSTKAEAALQEAKRREEWLDAEIEREKARLAEATAAREIADAARQAELTRLEEARASLWRDANDHAEAIRHMYAQGERDEQEIEEIQRTLPALAAETDALAREAEEKERNAVNAQTTRDRLKEAADLFAIRTAATAVQAVIAFKKGIGKESKGA